MSNERSELIKQMLDAAAAKWARHDEFETEVSIFSLDLLREIFPEGRTSVIIKKDSVSLTVTKDKYQDGDLFLVDIEIMDANTPDQKNLQGRWILAEDGIIDDDSGRGLAGGEPVISFVRKMYVNADEVERRFE